jgi:radical SAM superfamily enzyme YgiQ (UPF0313 family)
MRLLLINTPIQLANILGQFSTIYDDLKMVPIGMAYLASFVRKAGIEVKIIDQYAECLPLDDIYQRIESFRPDLIGYSATTPNYQAAIELARQVRNHFGHIKTVMGGPHPSVFPEETLNCGIIDFVVRGEGEYSLLSLCESIENTSGDFRDIPGLSYKKEGGFVHNPKRPVGDLDVLPLPAYDLLPMHLYSSPIYTKFASPVYQMIASRSCPFSCSYCINASKDMSGKFRKRNLSSVVDEIELLADRYKARQIQFWDPIFPFGKKQALEFCDIVLKRGLQNKIVWNCTTRAEFLDEGVIYAMKKAGCKGIGFGIESGVPELLRSVNKKADLEKIRDICRIAYKAGIVLMAGFILGFPDETKEMTQKTIDFAKSLDLHYAQFSLMTPYPGTPLYKELKAKGEIRDLKQKDYSSLNQSIGLTKEEPVWIPKGREPDELKTMQKKAYIQFYLRPKMISMQIRHLNIHKIKGVIRSLMVILRLEIQNIL